MNDSCSPRTWIELWTTHHHYDPEQRWAVGFWRGPNFQVETLCRGEFEAMGMVRWLNGGG